MTAFQGDRVFVWHCEFCLKSGCLVCSDHLEGSMHTCERSQADGRSPESSAVDHPTHYGGKDDPYETIKVLESWMSRLNLSGYQGGLYFNVVKYLSRAGLKGSRLEDMKKALWYLERLVAHVEGEDEGDRLGVRERPPLKPYQGRDKP